MQEKCKIMLAEGLQAMGLQVNEQAVHRLDVYCDRLLEKNKVMNLTAITEEGDVVTHHFLDSAGIISHFPMNGKKVIDVGTGAGFPGLVLKILDPTIQLTLLDTLGKRVQWLQEVCEELGLNDVKCVKGRAEEVSHIKEFRHQYDVSVSRAVASMTVLAELCMPYVKQGGSFIAMKSNHSDEELELARPMMGNLGAGQISVKEYKLPGTDIAHRLIYTEKMKETPKQFPRKWSRIKESR